MKNSKALLESLALSQKLRNGTLRVLKTKAEIKARSETLDVFAVAIPARYSSGLLNAIKNIVPGLESVDLQHLRRVAKGEFLPSHVLRLFDRTLTGSIKTENATRLSEDLSSSATPNSWNPADIRYLIICPVRLSSESILRESFSKQPPFVDNTFKLTLAKLPVPTFAPTSGDQANDWTSQYWPISYKNTNPYGPHPSMVQRAEVETAPSTKIAMALANIAAVEASRMKLGPAIGCAVLDSTGESKEDTVVAVAGDARWCGLEAKGGSGIVMAHAVQRAIAMVARKRLAIEQAGQDISHSRTAEFGSSQPVLDKDGTVFKDGPQTSIERSVQGQLNIPAAGYLCNDLDIYLTHEPCVMCSMAIIHSRFRRCVFQRRMLLTGGMAADSGLQYGIFWRPAELNWKMLTWEWIPETSSEDDLPEVTEHTHV